MAATETQQFTIARRATAEAVGTALLLAAVVGSGIMGERLSGGNVAIALLANSLATGGGLVVLILIFGPGNWSLDALIMRSRGGDPAALHRSTTA